VLADVARAMEDAGHWGFVVDEHWSLVYVTSELRFTFGGHVEFAEFAVGEHFFGTRSREASRRWRFGLGTDEFFRTYLEHIGGFVLADIPGGRDALRGLVDSSLSDIVDRLVPDRRDAISFVAGARGLDRAVGVATLAVRVRAPAGRVVGSMIVTKPDAGMAMIGAVTSMNDHRHFGRMQLVARADRRPAAILFADLEGSSPLARRLPTPAYFALGRRLVRAADQCVIDAGGIVGRHVGDGVVAFFLAESLGSESAAARACIEAARGVQLATRSVAERSGLRIEDVVLRCGLHWGSTLYVGNITTGGRSEVTALGDEVNEAARIEACATGGRALASKALVERLGARDAAALGLDLTHLGYTALGDLTTATEKARRDAPAIAVCDVA
jgi:class 3 adenylate cyclase